MKIFLTLCYLLAPCVLFAQLPQSNTDYSSLILAQNTGLKITDLAEMKISSQSTDNQNGVTHIYFNQYYKNIPIHNAVLGLHLDKAGNIAAFNHSFFKNLESNSAVSKPVLSAEEAAIFALNDKNKNSNITPTSNRLEKISSSQFENIFKNEKLAHDNIKVTLTWVVVNENLKLSWNVNWLTKDEQNWWNIRVDATNGNVLDENNWIAQCLGDKFQAANSISPKADQVSNFLSPKADPISNLPGNAEGTGEGKTSAKYKVLAMPVESPSHGNMTLLTDPADSLSSPYSWHDDNGATGNEYTITRGNNVYASEDKNNDNQPGYSPDGGSSLNFDFSFDKTKRHTDYLDAAITNLFYWNNLMHDVWYHYGFDDASGNFQVNNYGRGGAGSDEVNAEAQDGSGINNANFATPPDGINPRMQMYVWNVSSTSFLLRVTQPTGIAKQYSSVAAGFGPKLTTTPIIGNIILADDGSSSPTLACQNLINGNDINNQIALIDRGNCKFAEKVKFAENMGAKAVIIINNVTASPFTMGGDGATVVNIPSIMISKSDGDILKNALKTGLVKGRARRGSQGTSDRGPCTPDPSCPGCRPP